MGIYPVIMCGGSGTRLWPTSRQNQPKQFIPLVGERSSFQNTVLRMAQIEGATPPIVVAGVAHREHLRSQLAELGLGAQLILEPEARDSAPAMAAAAAWIAARDPNGIAVFVSADHHVPDSEAFARAVGIALPSARDGRIVTLGLKPTYPSTAFGYIRPDGSKGAVRPVAAFVEKPDYETAVAYIDQGFLWNSGNFIARAATLLAELDNRAPQISDSARRAVEGAEVEAGRLVLGDAFRSAPKISIDYAVMEKTDLASVAPSDFDWMDIGAWDAVFTASAKDDNGNVGKALFVESTGNLVRAALGIDVALVGVSNLAVVVERGAIVVSDLSQAQLVKKAGETFKIATPPAAFDSLPQAAAWFDQWMGTAALPLWAAFGEDHERGGFRETLVFDDPQPPRRARVQPRQAWAFAIAGQRGWPGPWKRSVDAALSWFEKVYRREDGLFANLASAAGVVLDAEPRLYDQAFALLAWSAMDKEEEALDLLRRLEAWRMPTGGWRETGPHPFVSNPHMHMLEAALAWEGRSSNPIWRSLADEIAHLALEKFISAEGGFLGEIFDETWSPAAGEAGRTLSPGHQFEWAHLLLDWGASRNDARASQAAHRLFDIGLKGFDPVRGVIVDGLWDDFSVRDSRARFWPQAEYLKASIALDEESHALVAMNALHRYLHPTTRGAWFDKMMPDGQVVPEAPPASTFYHLVGVWMALRGQRV